MQEAWGEGSVRLTGARGARGGTWEQYDLLLLTARDQDSSIHCRDESTQHCCDVVNAQGLGSMKAQRAR